MENRFTILFKGLRCPRSSREYKLAKIELQRLLAPLVAGLTVAAVFAVLVVVTGISARPQKTVKLDLAPLDPDPDPPPVDPPDPDPPCVDPQDDPVVEIAVDTPMPPTVKPSEPVAPTVTPTTTVSVKPAPVDRVAMVKSVVHMPVLGGRDSGTIGVATGGGPLVGDSSTEGTVLKILWWLKARQNTDGSWGSANKVANTAFAVLTFLAHGECPNGESRYRRDFGTAMQRGVEYLLAALATDESRVPRFAGSDGNEYSFLIGTYALCEAYGMTKNPNCREAAETCLARIVAGQSPTGGWDYKLNRASTRDDLSFAGWAIQALKAGKMAGLHPEGLDAALKRAVACLRKRSYSKSGGFTYTPTGGNDGGATGLAGVGALSLQFLGCGDEAEARNALAVMRDWRPAFDKATLSAGNTGACPQYYCYYATQCKYQAGMRAGATKEDERIWVAWNAAMKKTYPAAIRDVEEKVLDQDGVGHAQGYCENGDVHTSRPYMDTCLVALQLMVYYRYLPTTSVAAGATEGMVAALPSRQRPAADVSVTVDF